MEEELDRRDRVMTRRKELLLRMEQEEEVERLRAKYSDVLDREPATVAREQMLRALRQDKKVTKQQ